MSPKSNIACFTVTGFVLACLGIVISIVAVAEHVKLKDLVDQLQAAQKLDRVQIGELKRSMYDVVISIGVPNDPSDKRSIRDSIRDLALNQLAIDQRIINDLATINKEKQINYDRNNVVQATINKEKQINYDRNNVVQSAISDILGTSAMTHLCEGSSGFSCGVKQFCKDSQWMKDSCAKTPTSPFCSDKCNHKNDRVADLKATVVANKKVVTHLIQETVKQAASQHAAETTLFQLKDQTQAMAKHQFAAYAGDFNRFQPPLSTSDCKPKCQGGDVDACMEVPGYGTMCVDINPNAKVKKIFESEFWGRVCHYGVCADSTLPGSCCKDPFCGNTPYHGPCKGNIVCPSGSMCMGFGCDEVCA